MPITEEGSQSSPESDVGTTNECDANENKTDPYCIKWGKDSQNDITVDQINGTKNKAGCVHQFSLHVETKLSYFNFFYSNNAQRIVLFPQQIMSYKQEEILLWHLENS